MMSNDCGCDLWRGGDCATATTHSASTSVRARDFRELILILYRWFDLFCFPQCMLWELCVSVVRYFSSILTAEAQRGLGHKKRLKLRRSRMFIARVARNQSKLRRSEMNPLIHCAPTELWSLKTLSIYKHFIPTGC